MSAGPTPCPMTFTDAVEHGAKLAEQLLADRREARRNELTVFERVWLDAWLAVARASNSTRAVTAELERNRNG